MCGMCGMCVRTKKFFFFRKYLFIYKFDWFLISMREFYEDLINSCTTIFLYGMTNSPAQRYFLISMREFYEFLINSSLGIFWYTMTNPPAQMYFIISMREFYEFFINSCLGIFIKAKIKFLNILKNFSKYIF